MYRSLAPPAVITVRVYKNCDLLDERELEYWKPHLLAVYFCELFFHAIDVYFNSISANIYIDLLSCTADGFHLRNLGPRNWANWPRRILARHSFVP